MTIERTNRKIVYYNNGLTREFPVPFAYSRAGDLRLVLSGADGLEREITAGWRVEVNQAGDTAVIYPTEGPPLPVGQRLVIYRDTPLTQVVDLAYGGAFSPEVLEHDGFDRLEMQIQELQEEVDRAVKVSISDENPPDTAEELYARVNEIAGRAEDAVTRAEAARTGAEGARAGAEAETAGLAAKFTPAGGFAADDDGRYAVNFSRMPADKSEALRRSLQIPVRTALAAHADFYVRTDGADELTDRRDGKADTADRAWKTLQFALYAVAANYSLGRYNIRINIAAGTYGSSIIWLPRYEATGGQIEISGAGAARTILRGSSPSAVIAGHVFSGSYRFANLTLVNAVSSGSSNKNVVLGASGSLIYFRSCVLALEVANTARNSGAWTIVTAGIDSLIVFEPSAAGDSMHNCILRLSRDAGAPVRPFQFIVANAGIITVSSALTFEDNSDSPSAIDAVALAAYGGYISAGSGLAMSGAILGRRYQAESNGVIRAAGNPNYFPGSSAGTAESGGQYV